MSDKSLAPRSDMYAPRHIFYASWIGTPVAGAWFASRSLRTLGRAKHANALVVGGVVLSLVLGFGTWFLPADFPNMVIPGLYSMALYGLSSALFGVEVDARVADGARLGSWWKVVGVSIAMLLAVLLVWMGIGLGLESLGMINLDTAGGSGA